MIRGLLQGGLAEGGRCLCLCAGSGYAEAGAMELRPKDRASESGGTYRQS